jgi:DNA-binding transcriptional ArsR family regulator
MTGWHLSSSGVDRISFNHMVEDLELDDLFHALAHDARRHIVRRLTTGEFTIGQLAEPLEMSFAGASKHVKVLERAGVIDRTVVGREHRCRLRAESLRSAGDWLTDTERYWSARLDALETALVAGEDHP